MVDRVFESPARASPFGLARYELQYASVGHGGGGDGDTALWQTVDGSSKDTWEISIQVDGFDRYESTKKSCSITVKQRSLTSR